MNRRLTLDLGVRFYHQTPQHDINGTYVNFQVAQYSRRGGSPDLSARLQSGDRERSSQPEYGPEDMRGHRCRWRDRARSLDRKYREQCVRRGLGSRFGKPDRRERGPTEPTAPRAMLIRLRPSRRRPESVLRMTCLAMARRQFAAAGECSTTRFSRVTSLAACLDWRPLSYTASVTNQTFPQIAALNTGTPSTNNILSLGVGPNSPGRSFPFSGNIPRDGVQNASVNIQHKIGKDTVIDIGYAFDYSFPPAGGLQSQLDSDRNWLAVYSVQSESDHYGQFERGHRKQLREDYLSRSRQCYWLCLDRAHQLQRSELHRKSPYLTRSGMGPELYVLQDDGPARATQSLLLVRMVFRVTSSGTMAGRVLTVPTTSC